MIRADGIELCFERFGDDADPPVLLIQGIGASMLWWDEDFCRLLARGGRSVIRYDHRDTGRSTAFPPGEPGYPGPELVADAARVLEGLGIPAAHVVGISMGGALAQLLALDFGVRVLSLTLMSTSAMGEDLPPPAPEYLDASGSLEVDWGSADSVVEYLVADSRALAGSGFDEARIRALATRDVERARNFASAQNHGLLTGDEAWRHRLPGLSVPTLVIHGTADPLFPLDHGVALSREIPGARLVTLEGAGHELRPADYPVVAGEILEHTAGR